LEPDKCFYIQHEASVRQKKKIDLSIDPPPDLCVEVEISQRILDRADIYAKLGVPELWRDDGRRLHIYALSPDAEFLEAATSLAFPSLTAADLNELLDRSALTDEISWAADVRSWVRAKPGQRG
jgi:Uma2 family endonuclease